jgi:hypothetical protein
MLSGVFTKPGANSMVDRLHSEAIRNDLIRIRPEDRFNASRPDWRAGLAAETPEHASSRMNDPRGAHPDFGLWNFGVEST